MYIDSPKYNEGPVAGLMRLMSMTEAESKNDFKKRYVRVELSFESVKQRWQMVFYKNQQIIFQKTFSKTCRSSICHWFRTFDLEQDQEFQVKIPWKLLESGEKWTVEAYVNRRYWSLLNLPPELSLCQIIKWPENKRPLPKKNLFDWEEKGKVIQFPIVKKRR